MDHAGQLLYRMDRTPVKTTPRPRPKRVKKIKRCGSTANQDPEDTPTRKQQPRECEQSTSSIKYHGAAPTQQKRKATEEMSPVEHQTNKSKRRTIMSLLTESAEQYACISAMIDKMEAIVITAAAGQAQPIPMCVDKP